MTRASSPVAEEAARLAEAVQDWLTNATNAIPIAHDTATCKICPLCQLLSVVRNTRPEVFEHLSRAGSELIAALRVTVDSHEAQWRARRGDVEHIDIGD